MSAPTRRTARQVAVAPDPLVEGQPDYADSFEIEIDDADPRSPEEFARDALEGAPRSVYWTIYLAHRFVLRFDLAARRSPAHIIGWSTTHRERDAVRLEAAGPIVRAVILGRRPEPGRSVITTAVFFRRPVVARALMPLVGPVHRRISGHLLEYAAALPAARGEGAAGVTPR